MNTAAVARAVRKPSWRALLLPREHGSWSLALEPLVLGLLVAPSAAGAALALAALALFFARRPWQAARAGDARLPSAVAALGVLGATAAAALAGGITLAPESAVPVLAAVVPAGAAFAWFDRRKAGREAVAEMCGAICFAGFATAIVVAAGRDWRLAVAVGGFAAARSITSVLVVRTFLRRRKREAVSLAPAAGSAVIAAAAFIAYAAATSHVLPALWASVFALRTFWLLGPRAPAWSARRLGMMEAAVGAAVVLTVGIAWH